MVRTSWEGVSLSRSQGIYVLKPLRYIAKVQHRKSDNLEKSRPILSAASDPYQIPLQR